MRAAVSDNSLQGSYASVMQNCKTPLYGARGRRLTLVRGWLLWLGAEGTQVCDGLVKFFSCHDRTTVKICEGEPGV